MRYSSTLLFIVICVTSIRKAIGILAYISQSTHTGVFLDFIPSCEISASCMHILALLGNANFFPVM